MLSKGENFVVGVGIQEGYRVRGLSKRIIKKTTAKSMFSTQWIFSEWLDKYSGVKHRKTRKISCAHTKGS